MKVIVKFELGEQDLRRIAAHFGRGGRATRKDAQRFIGLKVSSAIEQCPAPKVRAPKKADVDRKTFGAPTGDTPEGAKAQRNRIAGIYRHAVV